LVGSSSTNPLANNTSLVARAAATLGAGSKVCELVPSGTRPVMSATSPATLAAIDVIGATVELICSRSPAAIGVPVAQAALATACTSADEPSVGEELLSVSALHATRPNAVAMTSASVGVHRRCTARGYRQPFAVRS